MTFQKTQDEVSVIKSLISLSNSHSDLQDPFIYWRLNKKYKERKKKTQLLDLLTPEKAATLSLPPSAYNLSLMLVYLKLLFAMKG